MNQKQKTRVYMTVQAERKFWQDRDVMTLGAVCL